MGVENKNKKILPYGMAYLKKVIVSFSIVLNGKIKKKLASENGIP